MQISQFEALLPRVTKPARYTNAEWNAIHKEWNAAHARFVLLYPDVYEVGMSHLGLHILYHVLNSHPDYLAERAYVPWKDMEQQLRQHGLPLASLESRTPLREFDVVGITLPYELTYTNILNALDLAGIPIRAADRTADDPLIIGGGPGAANPEPVAEFFDAILIGEGEEAIIEIAEVAAGRHRGAALERLAGIPGVYIPSGYRFSFSGPGPCGAVTPTNGAPPTIPRRWVEDLDGALFPTAQIVPFLETVHSRVTLEIMRGCPRGCRFCQAAAVYRPRRERSLQTLLRQAEEAVAATGFDEISLLAFTSVDYPQIEKLISSLVERFGRQGVGVALPSLRADTFSVTIANQIQRVRKSGLTFAPEAGTERLRSVIRKQMTEEDLFAAADAAFSSGWTRLKLYFMIGLPTETDDDVAAIADLVNRLVAFGRGALGPRRGRLQIAVSVNAFVPKPHTPFQWVGQDDMDALARKQRILQQALRDRAVKLSWTDPAVSALEAAISRGDRRVGRAIERAWQLGAAFDAWGEFFVAARWEQAFVDVGLDQRDYANQNLPLEAPLAWDHIGCGPGKEELRREFQRALGEGPTLTRVEGGA
jgi:radical SAM family uncharacterized protein